MLNEVWKCKIPFKNLNSSSFSLISKFMWNSVIRQCICLNVEDHFSSPKLTLFPLLTPTSTLPGPAPLKLRPYGAIQMCILLLLLLFQTIALAQQHSSLLLMRGDPLISSTSRNTDCNQLNTVHSIRHTPYMDNWQLTVWWRWQRLSLMSPLTCPVHCLALVAVIWKAYITLSPRMPAT